MYVHESYNDLHKILATARDQSHVIVSGCPGTGKSYFLVYELYHARADGKDIVIQRGTHPTMFSSTENSPYDIETMLFN